jgi:hypothetical protein
MHVRQWDGLDETGKRMESGMYFCELSIREGKNPQRMVRKMLMLK